MNTNPLKEGKRRNTRIPTAVSFRIILTKYRQSRNGIRTDIPRPLKGAKAVSKNYTLNVQRKMQSIMLPIRKQRNCRRHQWRLRTISIRSRVEISRSVSELSLNDISKKHIVNLHKYFLCV